VRKHLNFLFVGDMSKYEEQRLQRIAENKEKLEVLGLSHLPYSLKVRTQNTKSKKGK